MAVAEVTAEHHDHIGAGKERFDDEQRVYSSRAHHPNNARIRRVLHARGTRPIRARVRAPVAAEGQDTRFPLPLIHFRSVFSLAHAFTSAILDRGIASAVDCPGTYPSVP